MSELLKETCMSLTCHLCQGGLTYIITYVLPCSACGEVEGSTDMQRKWRQGRGQGAWSRAAALWELGKSYPEKGERGQIKKITESNLIAEYFWL